MLTIRFTPGCPKEVRLTIEPHLTRWKHLVPAWAHQLNVIWNDENTDAAMSVTAHYEYRRVDLYVHANYLTLPDRREQNLVHELMHVVTEPIANLMDDLQRAIVDVKPDLRPWIVEQRRMAVEMVTCDLTALVLAHGGDGVPFVDLDGLSGLPAQDRLTEYRCRRSEAEIVARPPVHPAHPVHSLTRE